MVETKWRPTLGLVVTVMLLCVLALPLGGTWLFRFYDNQLVRETENELIAQGAFIQAIMEAELRQRGFNADLLNTDVLPEIIDRNRIAAIEPELDLSTNPIDPPRSEAEPVAVAPLPVFLEIGSEIGSITAKVQRTTLAGFRLLDFNGIVIAGRNETGQSLAHVPEVREALSGRYASRIRQRISDSPRPPIYSISRGTDIRVFVAMPIEYESKVAGVAYLSRTPSHFLRELYGQRWNLAGAAAFMLILTGLIAILFVRTVKGPIDTLNERTRRLSEGDRTAIAPLDRHGTREVAQLANGLFSMSEKLFNRSDYIRNFASHVSHELKSPITSIHGAAELLRDEVETLSPERREKFLSNIIKDTERMSALLTRLRDLAATEAISTGDTGSLRDLLDSLSASNPQIKVQIDVPRDICLAIPNESSSIIFTNMIDNSLKHGAKHVRFETMEISDYALTLQVSDDGEGISEKNREKILDLFFTTRRETGGTGMGLNIVQSILGTYEGSIHVGDTKKGALFILVLPLDAPLDAS